MRGIGSFTRALCFAGPMVLQRQQRELEDPADPEQLVAPVELADDDARSDVDPDEGALAAVVAVLPEHRAGYPAAMVLKADCCAVHPSSSWRRRAVPGPHGAERGAYSGACDGGRNLSIGGSEDTRALLAWRTPRTVMPRSYSRRR